MCVLTPHALFSANSLIMIKHVTSAGKRSLFVVIPYCVQNFEQRTLGTTFTLYELTFHLLDFLSLMLFR